jgi:gamma-glutamyl hercynylcysteine S-oxide hydrolase
MHNGAIRDFRRKAMRTLRERLSDEAYSGLLGVTDSETIFAGLLDLLREDPADLAGAARETIRHVTEVCDGLDVKATLNLAVTDGTAMAFTRYSTGGPGNSLYFVEDAEAFPGAFVVASERLDRDPGWREVPDRHLLEVGEGTASLGPL